MSGLLYAITRPPEGAEAEYHRWYDLEHIPDRLNVTGFLAARRYVSFDGEPHYVALYDLADPAVLRLNAYRMVKEHRTPEESAMLEKLPLLDWRVYRSIDQIDGVGAGVEAEVPVVYVTSITPGSGQIDDFHDWHEMEFLPLLRRIPGVGRIQRFEQEEGSGPRFCTLVELASRAVVQGTEFRLIAESPWALRLARHASAAETDVLHLIRSFRGRDWVADPQSGA